MILLFTDFGNSGPYQAQMSARLRLAGYDGDIFPLFSDAPVFNPQAAGCLLAAYKDDFPKGSLFLSVVDPGVGSERRPLALQASGRWFVGPDNGLFEKLILEDLNAEAFEIVWRPEMLSASFHGRDLFAPVAADILAGCASDKLRKIERSEILTATSRMDLEEVVYIDHYGNAMTGIRGSDAYRGIRLKGQDMTFSRTFSDVPVGEPLAYIDANGLVEIAVNQGRADQYFDLQIGTSVSVLS